MNEPYSIQSHVVQSSRERLRPVRITYVLQYSASGWHCSPPISDSDKW